MTLGTVAAVVGIAGTAYGAYQSNRASRDARNAQDRALANSTTQLNPFAVNGPGGMFAGWGALPPGGGTGVVSNPGVETGGMPPMNGTVADILGRVVNGAQLTSANSGQQGITAQGVNLSAGDLEGVRAALSQFATQGVPSFSNGLPANVQQALGAFQGAQGIPDLQLNGLDRILGGANTAFTDAQGSLSQAGSMANSLFGNAQLQAASLGQTYDQAYNNTLGTLRAQARPEEERAMAGLTDNLFATGRMGSSGGALQTEAFARGLGQADLSRQLAATGQAQQAQQNALGLATGLFGAGDNLLNSAFSRFGNTANLAADLNQARFARSMYGNETMYNRAQNMLGTQINLAGLPAALQGAQLSNVNTALQGQSGIQSQLLQLFGAGLSAEQAAANARIGAGSNMAQIVGNPSFGAAGQANAAMWSQLGSSLLNNSGNISNLFGGGGYNIQSPDAWGALDAALASGQAGQ